MGLRHQIQASRFELKYIISERCAGAVRDFARRYLEPDGYGEPQQHCAYTVCSLYLDSADLTLCRATLDGVRNRFKLRIRFYDDSPQSPAYFEIKRRADNVVLKERAAVRRSSIPGLLAGHRPKQTDLANGNAEGLRALHRFCDLRSAIQAHGQVFVTYTREAYIPAIGNSVRLNFDRQLSASKYERGLAPANPNGGFHPRLGGVILELKFSNRFPSWMSDMVQIFNLERCRMPKYVTCVRSLRTREFRLMPQNQGVEV
ncbi:MAG: polyphosphate polymerase domain-containing protein [Planctomycetes bacterium]|nr:polyphosphate polymerase domain-containing protein [Planctomycetota bacterium]